MAKPHPPQASTMIDRPESAYEQPVAPSETNDPVRSTATLPALPPFPPALPAPTTSKAAQSQTVQALTRGPKTFDRIMLSEAEVADRAKELAFVVHRLNTLVAEEADLRAKFKQLLAEMHAERQALKVREGRLITAVRFGSEEREVTGQMKIVPAIISVE